MIFAYAQRLKNSNKNHYHDNLREINDQSEASTIKYYFFYFVTYTFTDSAWDSTPALLIYCHYVSITVTTTMFWFEEQYC